MRKRLRKAFEGRYTTYPSMELPCRLLAEGVEKRRVGELMVMAAEERPTWVVMVLAVAVAVGVLCLSLPQI